MKLNLSGADGEWVLQRVWGWLWGRSSHLPYKDPLSFAYLKGQAWGEEQHPKAQQVGGTGASQAASRH